MTEDPRVRRGTSVLWRSCGPDVLLMRPTDPRPVLLEGTAAVAWRLLGDPRTPASLAEELAGEFGADAAEVRTALDPFLADLLHRGLVEPVRLEESLRG